MRVDQRVGAYWAEQLRGDAMEKTEFGWRLARLYAPPFRWRVRQAWDVLCGKACVVYWREETDE